MVLKLYRAVAKRFVTFANRHEMNEHVSLHVMAAGKKLRRNTRLILDMIAKHSVKYSGCSWLAEATIAKTLGVHGDTVKRALKRLQELQIIRIEVVEASGIQLRYTVLNRFQVAEELQESLLLSESESSLTDSRGEVTSNVCETKESRETEDQVISEYVTEPVALDASYTPSNVPKPFVEAVRPFFNNASTIYSLWYKVLISYQKLGLSTSIGDLMGSIISGIKQSIFMLKSGKLKKDIGGYFYGVIYRIFTVVKRQEADIYNWLESC